MNGSPFTIPLLLDGCQYVRALVDSGCGCFGAIDDQLAASVGAEIIRIPPRKVRLAVGGVEEGVINQIAMITYDIDGWRARGAAYVLPQLTYSIILGRPWMDWTGAVMDPRNKQLTIRKAGGLVVREWDKRQNESQMHPIEIKNVISINRKGKGEVHCEIALTNIRDITRVLAMTIPSEKEKDPEWVTEDNKALPEELEDFKDLFDKAKASGLPPHRGRMDHHIRLKQKEDGSLPELPWGPLYSMSREQLLELRKQLTDLMDKGWIRASSSPAAAPVLLARKPGGGWRLCVDYRALNALTEADRYPLPLVKETLRTLSQAKWFSKIDIRAAFHKLRIKEGDEHLTAFRTRFGLFEWLVCPFGLTGAPATFQRYINSALKEALGNFATAYLDDILIHSNGTRADHMRKVRRVLSLLREAGLYADLKKCRFATKEVRYLGYIVEAGVAIRTDPEKVRAIQEWERPTSVKGVRSFIGFANFYREFIANFSRIIAPLTQLTKKKVPFQWNNDTQAAFERLKNAFITDPILAHWDPSRKTVLEADCSGTALGGCLSQEIDGVLHPVTYHSRALTPAQRNYTIHDKELLAIVDSTTAWTDMLMSVHKPFSILTDHKNLEYFVGIRELSERQHRWAERLSRFSYTLTYRPGQLAERPDALSRREQDEDKRARVSASVMKPERIRVTTIAAIKREETREVTLPKGRTLFSDTHMQQLWDEAVKADTRYLVWLKAVKNGERKFPTQAQTQQQIADCTIGAHGALLWRGVLWLPSWEPLTTTIIQRAHDSALSGHPGKNTTFHILRRDYHWEGMSADVARFVRNCHCVGAHINRRRRQGLLQPIPVADRYWSQISMDFMVDLPRADETSPRYLLVITDRLSKYVQLEALTSMGAEDCAAVFKTVWWRFRGFPVSIITNRGSDWLGHFWTTLCKVVGIEQSLSTAHHPQTDGGTERANQEVQAVLRVMVSFEQTDWPDCLAACQLALNNRNSSVTGVSPNLLLNGYNISPIQTPREGKPSTTTPQGRAALFTEHLRTGTELAQAAIAFTQQRQQDAANRSRRPAERFQVGDVVWFATRNIKTNRPSRKFDWLQIPYTVTAVTGPNNVELDLPGGLHKKVHVDLLERAATDPLPSQKQRDSRPGPALELEEEDPALGEYIVEEVLSAKNARGRGKRQVLVKWKGYLAPTWEPLEALKGTKALRQFEEQWGNAQYHDGPKRIKRK